MLKMSFLIQRLIRLGNHELIFLICGKIYRLIGNHRIGRVGLIYH